MKNLVPILILILVSLASPTWAFKLDPKLQKSIQKSVKEIEPEIRFLRFDITEINFTNFKGNFIFEIDNKTPLEIKNVNYDYTLEVLENTVASSKSAKLKLKPNGKTALPIPAEIRYTDIFKNTFTLLKYKFQGKHELPYTLRIHFLLDLKFQKVKIPQTLTGTFPLPSKK